MQIAHNKYSKKENRFSFLEYLLDLKPKYGLFQYVVTCLKKSLADNVNMLVIAGLHHKAQRATGYGSIDAYALMGHRDDVSAKLAYHTAYVGKYSRLVKEVDVDGIVSTALYKTAEIGRAHV